MQFILGNTGFAQEGISHQPNSAELLARGMARSTLSLQNLQSLLQGNSIESNGLSGRRSTSSSESPGGSQTPGAALQGGGRSGSPAAEDATTGRELPAQRPSSQESGMLPAHVAVAGMQAAAYAALATDGKDLCGGP
jgi:hypothetical protein